MATIKSFTDIGQSKRLAEILPIKSADLWYAERYAGQVLESGEYVVEDTPNYYLSLTCPSESNYSQDTIKDIPCWSTQALLDEIPYTLLNKDNEDLKLHIEKDGEQYYLFYENEYTGDMFEIETDMHDDLIDACYEMIMKLKEKDSL